MENLGEKKALLIGLKHPRMRNSSEDYVKVQILRMKKFLTDLRGFSEDNITLLIEEESRSYPQPTDFNIRAEACYLIEYANPGDTLFIHLIAHGCFQNSITSSDKQFIPDHHFRALVSIAGSKGCTLTIVSDCLIENSVCCTLGSPTDSRVDRDKFDIKHPNVACISEMYRGYCPTGLSQITSIHKILHTLSSGLQKSSTSRLPNSRVILFNAFQFHNKPQKGAGGIPELFLASPTTITPPNQHTLYGGFTTAILDIIEETQGQVTNAELAHKAMKKLRIMHGIHQKPGLHCNSHHHAYAPFCPPH